MDIGLIWLTELVTITGYGVRLYFLSGAHNWSVRYRLNTD